MTGVSGNSMEVLSYFLLLICVFKGGDSLQSAFSNEWASGLSVGQKPSSPPVGSAAKPSYNQWKQQCGANPHFTIEKDFKECVDDIYGSLYTGTEEFTKSGEMCSPWTAQDLSRDTGSALQNNFCRNNGQKYLWCRKAKQPGWEVCDVWTCSQKKEMGYWGTDVQKTPRKNRVETPKPTQAPKNLRVKKRSTKSSKKLKKVPISSYMQGGTAVNPQNGWASFVRLIIKAPDGSGTLFCGATVIHKQWAITAAHCFAKGSQIKHYDHPLHKERKSDIHREFDVSLIKIDRPVDPSVIPFCLPDASDPLLETKARLLLKNSHLDLSKKLISMF